ncbi:TonB-dependent receptor [Cryomorphaceae bacterium]|nr:TonB-dependent receptor [Cryomorphaceae bacterium]
MIYRICLTLFLFGLLSLPAQGQEVTQHIFGTVQDRDALQPLPGANIVLTSVDPPLGAVTNADGTFRLSDVPVGRHTLEITFIGYGTQVIPNVVVTSGNAVRIDVALVESAEVLGEVELTSRASADRPTDDMVLVSGRSITVEETKRIAGAIDDPARMVTSFAGVTNGSDGNNDIIVRGNSPKGVLWRLEGVEIYNPNHFADEGFTGGPINALNSQVLGTSNFYTGAFAPRYGNALSGVMDMTLRNPSTEDRQYSATLSVLGTDLTAEGPFVKGGKASYLVNYRYSTLALISNLGFLDFDGIPEYQDAAFKVNLPLGDRHSLSVFGMGGYSHIEQLGYADEEETEESWSSFLTSKMGVVGANHTWVLGDRSYFKNTLAITGRGQSDDYQEQWDDIDGLDLLYRSEIHKYNVIAQSIYHHKIDATSKLQAGVTGTRLHYNLESQMWNSDTDRLETTLESSGSTLSAQAFVSWKKSWGPRWETVAGLHLLYFDLNSSLSPEPRLSIAFQENENRRWSFGAGVHSRLETVSMYLAEVEQPDGSFTRPNDDLGPTKSAHFVLGMTQELGEHHSLSAEVYYQHLYDVPIGGAGDPEYSLLNSWGWFSTVDLANDGTGRNYGLDLSVRRDFSRDYYYMATASVYRSFFTPFDGVERNSVFDGQYAFNVLGGKEWKLGKVEKHRTLFVNTKVAYTGGQWYTPVDLEASIAEGSTVRVDDLYSAKGEGVFKLDLAIGLRRSRANWSSEFKIDVQNVTANQAVVYDWYNSDTQSVEYGYQFPLLPVISYKVSW